MSLENMKNRLNYYGGFKQQDRMIRDKLQSMLSATKSSYHAGQFSIWGFDEAPDFVGLFNPIRLSEDYDVKMISTEFSNGLSPGTYIEWKNTNTNWIVFLQEKTELAYFRGRCRLCSHKIQWVDKNRVLLETLVSVVGPSEKEWENTNLQVTGISFDVPNGSIGLLVQDNPTNREFFTRYQTLLLNGVSYRIGNVDTLSMPGVLKVLATEYYANLIEDSVEEDIRNKWNVLPILATPPSEIIIEGPVGMKPQGEAVFSLKPLINPDTEEEVEIEAGHWIIIENQNTNKLLPAVILTDPSETTVKVRWESLRSGVFTLGYKTVSGDLYQKVVYVESLF